MAYAPWIRNKVLDLHNTGHYKAADILRMLGQDPNVQKKPNPRTIRRWIEQAEQKGGVTQSPPEAQTDVELAQAPVERVEKDPLPALRKAQKEVDQKEHWDELRDLARDLKRSLNLPDYVAGVYVPVWGGSVPKPERWLYALVPFDLYDLPPRIRYLDSHLGEHSFMANHHRAKEALDAYWEAKTEGRPTKDLEDAAWQEMERLCEDLEPERVRNMVVDGYCEACPASSS